MTVESDGIRRVRFPERLDKRKLMPGDPELESFNARDGLTDDSANNVFEDREGNIWVSSKKGLDRFRHSHLVPVKLSPSYQDLTLLPGRHGEVWVASAFSNPMLLIRVENILAQNTPMRSSNVHRKISSVYRDDIQLTIPAARNLDITLFLAGREHLCAWSKKLCMINAEI